MDVHRALRTPPILTNGIEPAGAPILTMEKVQPLILLNLLGYGE